MRRRKLQGRSSSMADPVLKFPPEQKANPSPNPRTKIAAEPRRRLIAGIQRDQRVALLVAVSAGRLVARPTFQRTGGPDLTTHHAHDRTPQVLMPPDASVE